MRIGKKEYKKGCGSLQQQGSTTQKLPSLSVQHILVSQLYDKHLKKHLPFFVCFMEVLQLLKLTCLSTPE